MKGKRKVTVIFDIRKNRSNINDDNYTTEEDFCDEYEDDNSSSGSGSYVIFDIRKNKNPQSNNANPNKTGFDLRKPKESTRNTQNIGFDLRKKKPEKSDRAEFTTEQLDKFSHFSPDLKAEGFVVSANTAGRVFKSDTSNCSIARLMVPRRNPKGKGYQKYIQTAGTGERFFKQFIADPSSNEIILVEGVFDGLGCYVCGKNAIAYSGVLGAFEGRNIHRDLETLLTAYDRVIIGYDIDLKVEQQLFVEHHILQLCRELEKLDKETYIIDVWERGLGKDFSAILANRGKDTLQEIISSYSPRSNWIGLSASATYTPTIIENTQYITKGKLLELSSNHKFLFANSPMGSGKTFSLADILSANNDKGSLIISPLRVLGRQICKDLKTSGLNIDYRDDITATANWERIICCLESISTTGKLKINPDGSQMIGKILVIDEVAQVIENLLEGGTISRTRKEVVELFTALIRSAERCIFLSADLTDYHCELLLKIIGEVDEKNICKYQNTYKRNQFKGYNLGDVTTAINFTLELLAKGKKVFLGIDSQKTTSTYGTGNLAELFSKGGDLYGLRNIPRNLILIIDSKTTTTKGHDAYLIVVEGQKHLLNKYLLIIVSPSVESGFNLKPDEYSPDAMVLIHMGCSAPNGIVQLSMRVRDLSVPRYFGWGGYVAGNLKAGGGLCKGQVKRFISNQVKQIEEATNAKYKNALLADSTKNALDLSLNLDVEDLNLADEYYALQAIKNIQMLNRVDYVFSKLRSQGAIIENFEYTKGGSIKPELQEIKERRIQEEAKREFIAPNLDDKQIDKLKEQTALTIEQQDSISKYYSQKTYKFDDVTVEELIDKKNGLLPAEELLFWLTEGRNFAEFQEQERILRLQVIPIYNSTKLLEDSNGTKIYKQDIVQGSFIHKVVLLEELGIHDALNFALKHGVADLFLEGTEAQKFKPEPITQLVNAVKTKADKWCKTFGWNKQDIRSKTATVFGNILKEIGYEFTNKVKVRTRAKGITKQVKLFQTIKPTRSIGSRNKRFVAYTKYVTEKFEAFKQTQLFVNIGRTLIADTNYCGLVDNYGIDAVLEASRRLPRADYGLSKHSQVLMQQYGFNANINIPIEIVTPENVDDFTQIINNWITSKTEIGFDTETCSSIIHKAHCFIKNDKWYWHNPQTNKNQQVKPGLDQNNNQVRLIQFSDGDTTFVVDLGKNDAPAIPLWLKDAWVAIDKLTRQNIIVGHNLKFDTSSIKKYGLTIKKPYCTMLATKLLHGDCGAGKVMQGGYGLKSCVFNLLGLPVDKSEQMSNWGAETLTDSQIIYAAKDAVLTLILKKRLELIFNNPRKWGFAEFENEQGKHANLQLLGVENRNIYHTTEMQWRGVPCDIKALRECITKLEKVRADVEQDWKALQMPCEPTQAKAIVTELNKRYVDKQHPFEPQEIAESLGINLDNPDLELPEITENFTSTSKDVINDNPNVPELLVLKAWRSFNAAITQLSKVLLSVEINGSCKTEYGVLSGTGRMSCGNQYGLGTPNLQAFIKNAKGKFYGFIKDAKSTPLKFWDKPSIEETIPIRGLFKLTDKTKAFFTEDANASHSRLAVGFGKCDFGKSVLEDQTMDAHSMFSMMALQALLAEDNTCLDAFPEIRDYVKDLPESEIRTATVAKGFKSLDAEKAGKRFRDAAKTLFYSVLNGAQADKMRKVLSGTIGQAVSVNAGEAMFAKFWGLYQGIGDYIKKILAEAEDNELNFGGLAFNMTTLPDGVKLLYARKNGDLATTNLIACQWSRSEATALKKVMASVEEMPGEWGTALINMVHDELGITCDSKYWQQAYSFTSDSFAREYDVYLQGFIPGDEPTETKLAAKLTKDANYIPTSWADK